MSFHFASPMCSPVMVNQRISKTSQQNQEQSQSYKIKSQVPTPQLSPKSNPNIRSQEHYRKAQMLSPSFSPRTSPNNHSKNITQYEIQNLSQGTQHLQVPTISVSQFENLRLNPIIQRQRLCDPSLLHLAPIHLNDEKQKEEKLPSIKEVLGINSSKEYIGSPPVTFKELKHKLKVVGFGGSPCNSPNVTPRASPIISKRPLNSTSNEENDPNKSRKLHQTQDNPEACSVPPSQPSKTARSYVYIF